MSQTLQPVEKKKSSGEKQSAETLLASVGVDVSQVRQTTTPPTITPPVIPLTARTLAWKDPARVWYVGDSIVPADIVTISGGDLNVVLATPSAALLSAAATGIALKITAAEKGGFGAAELATTIDVVKRTGTITWADPPPMLINTKLSATQLNAKVTPDTLPRTYDPASGKTMATAGVTTLSVSSPGDAGTLPIATVSVTLTVAASKTSLAQAFGTVEMKTGRAFIDPPGGSIAEEMVGKWDLDTDGLKTLGKKIAEKIKDLTEDELKKYMQDLKSDPKFQDFTQITRGAKGGLSDYPNDILRFTNGLQVRYKPKGDQRNQGTPMFCVEVRTSEDLTEKQDGAAFKVMPDGGRGAKGHTTTKIPDWITAVTDPTERADLEKVFMDSACATTHLKCKPKQPQVITWNHPAEVPLGTKLAAASAMGNAVCTYQKGTAKITVGAVLASGDNQTIQVTTPATDRYLPGDQSFPISVKKPAQAVTWNGDISITFDTKLTKAHLCAVCPTAGVLTYTATGGKILSAGDVAGAMLAAGANVITVIAGETPTLAASPPVTATFTLTKRAQEITWDPPEQIEAGTKWSVVLNATYFGQDDADNGPTYVSYGAPQDLDPDEAPSVGTYEVNLFVNDADWYEDADDMKEITVIPAKKPVAKEKTVAPTKKATGKTPQTKGRK